MTNTSLEPIGEIDGFPIKPCVKSGFCCTLTPCTYGEWNEDESACKHLMPPNEIGQRGCGKFEWIKENVAGWEFYPGFGAGCCAAIGNHLRQVVIKNIKEQNL